MSEPFWYIYVSYRPAADAAAGAQGGGQQQPPPSCEFKWVRDRLFDQDVATMLYEAVAEELITATVMQVGCARNSNTHAALQYIDCRLSVGRFDIWCLYCGHAHGSCLLPAHCHLWLALVGFGCAHSAILAHAQQCLHAVRALTAGARPSGDTTCALPSGHFGNVQVRLQVPAPLW